MAGIGFKLQKLFQEDYFSSRIKAYTFAGLVTSGPWLVVIGTIALIQWITSTFPFLNLEEKRLFNISVAYCFIFSQVLFGIQQLIVTRYTADLFYQKRTGEVFSTFIGMTKVTLGLSLLSWLIFAGWSSLPFLYELLMLTLYVTVNMIWVLFLFLSAAKFYQAVAYSFLSGGLVSFLLVWLIGRNMSSLPEFSHSPSFFLLLSFTGGMIITLFGLLMCMLMTFPERSKEGQYSYLSYFDKFPSLFWTGFLYNVGIWVCNWVIWFGEGRSTLEGSFIYHQIYDTAIFWSYLTIIPAMIMFVVSLETRFYERYRVFYGYINEGGTLQQIKKSKEAMQLVLKQEMGRLIRSQGIISLLILLSAGYIVSIVALDSRIISIFRFTTVGAFSNAMVLVITLILLYFEDRRGAMYTSIVFFGLNLSLSLVFIPFGYEGYGLSFSIGSTCAFLFSVLRLIIFIEKVDYYAFCQPQAISTNEKRTPFSKMGRWLNKNTLL